MIKAVLYAHVSSKDQERDGYSIPAQLKLLREYAGSRRFQLIREFIDIETAKIIGRKQFDEMVRFLKGNSDCRTILVEKTDRLYRNFRDCVTLEDLDVEIHLPKEGQVIGKNSKSQAKLVHGIQVVIARNYIENLRDEVLKGMREKAEQGIYPSRPPIGYRNNKLEHTIEVDKEKAPIARRAFEHYAAGSYSLATLRDAIFKETGIKLNRAYLEKLLKNPFYVGLFVWQGKTYQGTHTPLIEADLFHRVQTVFQGHNRPKYARHQYAFSGLLNCAYDGCLITAEMKKGQYVYYHCTGSRGECARPYFREEELGTRLGRILQDIFIPDEILEALKEGLEDSQSRSKIWKLQEQDKLRQRLAAIRRRIDQAYMDKLDGKISEDFWSRQMDEWHEEEQQVLMALQGLAQTEADRVLTPTRILELANKAYSLYVKQKPAEQAQLLKIVLSNCRIDSVSLYPTYRKPFDMIFNRARNEEWRA
ncbi:MAG: recombinase family protein [Acidobacteria bacterium]|nr:recombinase family protein [Acidobacteriota bacterium]